MATASFATLSNAYLVPLQLFCERSLLHQQLAFLLSEPARQCKPWQRVKLQGHTGTTAAAAAAACPFNAAAAAAAVTVAVEAAAATRHEVWCSAAAVYGGQQSSPQFEQGALEGATHACKLTQELPTQEKRHSRRAGQHAARDTCGIDRTTLLGGALHVTHTVPSSARLLQGP